MVPAHHGADARGVRFVYHVPPAALSYIATHHGRRVLLQHRSYFCSHWYHNIWHGHLNRLQHVAGDIGYAVYSRSIFRPEVT